MSTVRPILLGSSRPAAEAHFVSRTRSQYLGGGSLLCQILGGLKLFVIGEDVGFTPHMIFEGYWEFWLTRHFAQVIRPGDTVIDIGANLGYYTLLAGDLVGETGRVVAIEPNPDVFRRLTASIGVNGFTHRTEARNVALAGSQETGTRRFFVPHGEPKNGRFVDPHEDETVLAVHGALTDVTLGSIDPADFQRVDFIKIDVEGAELAVLDHLRPILEKFRPKLVCEINFARGYSWDDVAAAFGTDTLAFLDFDSTVKPLTRTMAETQQLGEDWLVYLDLALVANRTAGRTSSPEAGDSDGDPAMMAALQEAHHEE
jgi:FkbM family methyltransferase